MSLSFFFENQIKMIGHKYDRRDGSFWYIFQTSAEIEEFDGGFTKTVFLFILIYKQFLIN